MPGRGAFGGGFRRVRRDKMGALESFLGRVWADGLKEEPAEWPQGGVGARGIVRHTCCFLGVMQRREAGP